MKQKSTRSGSERHPCSSPHRYSLQGSHRPRGQSPYEALLDAGVSRLRPVSMAAFTTVLGMTPLMWDPFYQGLAATVAGGLIGSTVLVLLVVPLFYMLFYRIKPVAS